MHLGFTMLDSSIELIKYELLHTLFGFCWEFDILPFCFSKHKSKSDFADSRILDFSQLSEYIFVEIENT